MDINFNEKLSENFNEKRNNTNNLNDFVKNYLKNDRKTFFNDYALSQSNDLSKKDILKHENNLEFINPRFISNNYFNQSNNSKKQRPIIADFTEYNPLHNGHYHCMNVAKNKVKDGLFVAIVPGLFERSGRGIPFILTRYARAKIAVSLGADIVLEGPPMGIMGSGQYSLCLCKMFQDIKADFIPRGYRPFEEYNEILNRINMGHGVAPKPYKIVDMDTKEVLLNGKLEEDNYVIVSFSKSFKKIGFDFKDKFIFVKRIEGVSGTKIRETINSLNFNELKAMMPIESIEILKSEMNNNRAPLNQYRDETTILNNLNSLNFYELLSLNLMNQVITEKIIDFRENKEFESINELLDILPNGFSSHFKARILSILEANINKDVIHNYIDKYPFIIRVLDYKNESILKDFKDKLNLNYL
ncbi:nucleotidyltransferase family protein [Methanobrevibacter curvatus]|uniref:Putative cytidyltransferase-related C-terminal region domain-containing protein n=1 Tax=Methanobrevibacter curvatus TaxID=49547 RepID=A0A165ZQK7_9EURY|nr:nucleotidyltransferase family protein [Methanobrevibacter curvatus]KZX11033.1 hypothetical protein MBCUR_15880 [Methanobrevibacter curvatus]